MERAPGDELGPCGQHLVNRQGVEVEQALHHHAAVFSPHRMADSPSQRLIVPLHLPAHRDESVVDGVERLRTRSRSWHQGRHDFFDHQPPGGDQPEEDHQRGQPRAVHRGAARVGGVYSRVGSCWRPPRPPARPRSECIRGHLGESRQERTTVEQTWFQTSVNRSGLGLHWRRAAQARQAHEKHISLRLPAQGRSTRLGSGAGVQLERQTGVAICLHGDS